MVSSSKIEIQWNCFEEELEESSRVTRQGLLINLVGVEKSNVIVFSADRGGNSAYERGGDARRKFRIKPLKETDLGVAQAFFDPQKRPC